MTLPYTTAAQSTSTPERVSDELGSQAVAVSTNWESLFVGILIIRALLFCVCIRAPDFLKMFSCAQPPLQFAESRTNCARSPMVEYTPCGPRPSSRSLAPKAQEQVV